MKSMNPPLSLVYSHLLFFTPARKVSRRAGFRPVLPARLGAVRHRDWPSTRRVGRRRRRSIRSRKDTAPHTSTKTSSCSIKLSLLYKLSSNVSRRTALSGSGPAGSDLADDPSIRSFANGLQHRTFPGLLLLRDARPACRCRTAL